MIEVNKIYNEDCVKTMSKMGDKSVNAVITSPPQNMTFRRDGDVHKDWKPETEYIDWIVKIFNNFDRVLVDNGVVLFNFSYSIDPSLPYKLVLDIVHRTNFALADTIIWKKSCGVPFPADKRKLSRIWEFIFVFVRKTEMATYTTNRVLKSVSEKTGQKYYECCYNIVEAKNNDGKCDINRATFSSELVMKLLNMYVGKTENNVVYDPFMGSGTTAVGAKKYGVSYIGSEISTVQCDYANKRVEGV